MSKSNKSGGHAAEVSSTTSEPSEQAPTGFRPEPGLSGDDAAIVFGEALNATDGLWDVQALIRAVQAIANAVEDNTSDSAVSDQMHRLDRVCRIASERVTAIAEVLFTIEPARFGQRQ